MAGTLAERRWRRGRRAVAAHAADTQRQCYRQSAGRGRPLLLAIASPLLALLLLRLPGSTGEQQPTAT